MKSNDKTVTEYRQNSNFEAPCFTEFSVFIGLVPFAYSVWCPVECTLQVNTYEYLPKHSFLWFLLNQKALVQYYKYIRITFFDHFISVWLLLIRDWLIVCTLHSIVMKQIRKRKEIKYDIKCYAGHMYAVSKLGIGILVKTIWEWIECWQKSMSRIT